MQIKNTMVEWLAALGTVHSQTKPIGEINSSPLIEAILQLRLYT